MDGIGEMALDLTDEISALGATEKHVEFARFLAANSDGQDLPDYKALDLMQIPHLVPYIWVLDFRDGIDDGLLFLFSGTDLDQHFGKNLMGTYLEENYAEYHSDDMHQAYTSVYLDKRPVYTERSDYYPDVNPQVERRIKVLLVPCSGDGTVINYAIGLTTFENTGAPALGGPKIVQF